MYDLRNGIVVDTSLGMLADGTLGAEIVFLFPNEDTHNTAKVGPIAVPDASAFSKLLEVLNIPKWELATDRRCIVRLIVDIETSRVARIGHAVFENWIDLESDKEDEDDTPSS